MLEPDGASKRDGSLHVTRTPALPIASEAIKRIARRGQQSPFVLTPTEIYHLCNAVVAATRS